MQITLTVNPQDPDDIDVAQSFLASLKVEPLSAPPLPEIVAALLDKEKYGPTRLKYATLVALNDPSSTPLADLVGVVASTVSPAKDANKAVGGVHRSLEQSWKSLGGTAYTPMFISSDSDGNHSMDSAVAEAVMAYFGADAIRDLHRGKP